MYAGPLSQPTSIHVTHQTTLDKKEEQRARSSRTQMGGVREGQSGDGDEGGHEALEAVSVSVVASHHTAKSRTQPELQRRRAYGTYPSPLSCRESHGNVTSSVTCDQEYLCLLPAGRSTEQEAGGGGGARVGGVLRSVFAGVVVVALAIFAAAAAMSNSGRALPGSVAVTGAVANYPSMAAEVCGMCLLWGCLGEANSTIISKAPRAIVRIF